MKYDHVLNPLKRFVQIFVHLCRTFSVIVADSLHPVAKHHQQQAQRKSHQHDNTDCHHHIRPYDKYADAHCSQPICHNAEQLKKNLLHSAYIITDSPQDICRIHPQKKAVFPLHIGIHHLYGQFSFDFYRKFDPYIRQQHHIHIFQDIDNDHRQRYQNQQLSRCRNMKDFDDRCDILILHKQVRRKK